MSVAVGPHFCSGSDCCAPVGSSVCRGGGVVFSYVAAAKVLQLAVFVSTVLLLCYSGIAVTVYSYPVTEVWSCVPTLVQLALVCRSGVVVCSFVAAVLRFLLLCRSSGVAVVLCRSVLQFVWLDGC